MASARHIDCRSDFETLHVWCPQLHSRGYQSSWWARRCLCQWHKGELKDKSLLQMKKKIYPLPLLLLEQDEVEFILTTLGISLPLKWKRSHHLPPLCRWKVGGKSTRHFWSLTAKQSCCIPQNSSGDWGPALTCKYKQTKETKYLLATYSSSAKSKTREVLRSQIDLIRCYLHPWCGVKLVPAGAR